MLSGQQIRRMMKECVSPLHICLQIEPNRPIRKQTGPKEICCCVCACCNLKLTKVHFTFISEISPFFCSYPRFSRSLPQQFHHSPNPHHLSLNKCLSLTEIFNEVFLVLGQNNQIWFNLRCLYCKCHLY